MEADTRAARARRVDGGTLPTFLIIGAMRSGTTALTRYLRVHPQVFMPRKKELHFFDLNFDRGLDWYAAWFADADGAQAIGEASPTYMYFESAVVRMAEVLPDARLIAILRNPVDRAYSHYWWNRARGQEPLGFADAIAAEPERLASGDFPARRRGSYLDRGRFLRQLQRVCDHYQRGAILVLVLEELRARPGETYSGLCRFLDIEDSFAPAQLGEPAAGSARFRSPALKRVARRLGRPVRARVRRFNIVRFEYPPMDPAFRAELMARFEQENAALSAWLGKDLSVWWK